MKALFSAVLLTLVGMSSTAMAQIYERCRVDDVLLNETVRLGRNAWARKCGFITPAKEAYYNAEGEYLVFFQGCYAYPNVAPGSSCYVHVPISESAACVPLDQLTKIGVCVNAFAPAAPGENLEEQHGELTADSLPQALWAYLHRRLLVREEANVREL
ncbi:hypothetical protein CYFUS_000698 [Cystobacter fuscus]|uniref:Secreted protein n=1 Tax=Cystobacter fuscus TaxID=43 RepID=A0A250IWL3_9BACT|nr:hypothetical protein [Cystobacter fuscus]ATB35286.1 hypothetical protein CYFUS_000698 [Cystobacter fuscus]